MVGMIVPSVVAATVGNQDRIICVCSLQRKIQLGIDVEKVLMLFMYVYLGLVISHFG